MFSVHILIWLFEYFIDTLKFIENEELNHNQRHALRTRRILSTVNIINILATIMQLAINYLEQGNEDKLHTLIPTLRAYR